MLVNTYRRNNLELGLDSLIETQRDVQITTGNEDMAEYSAHAMRVFTLALIDEIMELLHEFQWKPWRHQVDAPDPAKVAEEVADILAFTGSLLGIVVKNTGLTPAQIADAYARKTEVNVGRIRAQSSSY